MPQDGRFHGLALHARPAVPRPVCRLEEFLSDRWKDLPIPLQSIEIPVWNAATEVRIEIMQVLRLGRVDVARDVQVVVVRLAGNLGHRNHARVARDFQLPVDRSAP